IEERGQNGWLLANVICNDNNSHRSGHSAFIELDPGQHVTCEFINEAAKPAPDDKKPTPKPSPPVIAPPSTGEAGLADASGTSWPVTVAVLVVASGVAWLSIRSLAARRS